ncbi:uncharacterized protein LOC127842506 [Dreissena polymorpha]|uniref:uncharacterized protein LOC127842506 n=1 Tax=Dreissena polymorpha TaxID=45954 RepID=UPI0022643CF4|nr:uncharacterized protein LOC127842506 [Dreissena polymorpha]XP_052227998.1 uncharacterized protein LOC127842506 [Dreissena polymorpha]
MDTSKKMLWFKEIVLCSVCFVVCISASSVVTLHVQLIETSPRVKYELVCSWAIDPYAPVGVYRKKKSDTDWQYILTISYHENGCSIRPPSQPDGVKCGCLIRGRTGCNITSSPEISEDVEWMCEILSRPVIKQSNSVTVSIKDINQNKGQEYVFYTTENQSVLLNCSDDKSITKKSTQSISVNEFLVQSLRNGTQFNRIQKSETNEHFNVSFTRDDNGTFMSCIRGLRIIARWTIVVLYPPTVFDMGYIAIIENRTISKECKYIHGNPTQTNISWWVGSKLVVLGSQLIINQVSRQSAAIYMCEAMNRFDQDDLTYIGQGSGMLQLKVQYPATITRFHINALPQNMQVTLIETENATFQCIGDGNPQPTLTLIKQPTDDLNETLTHTFDRMILRYDIAAVSSKDSGQYTCASSNSIGENARILHLYIKSLQELGNLMHGRSMLVTDTSVNLQWILSDAGALNIVQNNTCFVLYKTSKEIVWDKVIIDINWTLNLTLLKLDLELTHLRPDIQYEAQLIASFSSGNYSIAPTLTFKTSFLSGNYSIEPTVPFKTLSFSEETKLYIIVAAIVGSVLIMCIMGAVLRLCLKRSLRSDTQGEIENVRMSARNNMATMSTVGNASEFEDHYDCIDMSRMHPSIDPQVARSAHIESVPLQIIGGTNLRDEICLQTKTANKDAYYILNRARNPSEEQYNYLGEVDECEVEEYTTECCHSSSSTTDSVISDTCLQYLTVIDNLPTPPESFLTSEYDDVANTSIQPRS